MKYFAAIYAIGFIITFGAAYNRNPVKSESKSVTSAELNTADSLMCSMAWPLYWSYRAFQKEETK